MLTHSLKLHARTGDLKLIGPASGIARHGALGHVPLEQNSGDTTEAGHAIVRCQQSSLHFIVSSPLRWNKWWRWIVYNVKLEVYHIYMYNVCIYYMQQPAATHQTNWCKQWCHLLTMTSVTAGIRQWDWRIASCVLEMKTADASAK